MSYRYSKSYSLEHSSLLKLKMLYWANRHSIFLFLDHNFDRQYSLPDWDWCCGIGYQKILTPTEDKKKISAHDDFNNCGEYWMGHVSYDYKNEIEPRLQTQQPPSIPFEDWQFFIPLIFVQLKGNTLTICSNETHPDECISEILHQNIPPVALDFLTFQLQQTREEYLLNIEHIKKHLLDGDCYEINYCLERCARLNKGFIDMPAWYDILSHSNPAPFAALYKTQHKYVLSCSPERYLCKSSNKIIAQPMKGTVNRSPDPTEDELLKWQLKNSVKNRSENIMITDLMRNDLAKFARVGSVKVSELFGIYTFAKVHQMVSTIEAELIPGVTWPEVVEHSFPMGSMTGAPKVKVMELIDRYELRSRGIFSGTLGMIDEEGNYDFNVLIRSIIYDQENGIVSLHSGGAITYDSVAEEEWDELILKASFVEQAACPFEVRD